MVIALGLPYRLKHKKTYLSGRYCDQGGSPLKVTLTLQLEIDFYLTASIDGGAYLWKQTSVRLNRELLSVISLVLVQL